MWKSVIELDEQWHRRQFWSVFVVERVPAVRAYRWGVWRENTFDGAREGGPCRR